ncbi:MAG: AMP-binding protein [Clostridia bacterium]|nr:AMP-binding protein [Clostridia bacterium]
MIASENKGRSGFAATLRERTAKEKPDNVQYNKQIAALRSQFSAMGKPESLQELLLRAAAVYADRTQVVEFTAGGNISYSAKQLCEDAAALAFSLTKAGLAGKNIGIIGRNGYAWLVSFFAACCGVGTAVPLDKELRGEKLKYLIEKADVELVLCDDSLLAGVREAAGDVPCIPFVGTQEDTRSLPMLIKQGRELLADGTLPFSQREVHSQDIAAIVFTSGTTGANKGVMLTHGNLIENAYSLTKVLPPMASALSVLPMNHVFELGCTVLTAISINGILYINDSLRHLLKNAVACQPQMIVVVPAFIDFLYKELDTQLKKNGIKGGAASIATAPAPIRALVKKAVVTYFGGSLPYFACGGAAVRKDYLQTLQSLGLEIYLGYGLSESAPIAALNMHADKKPESVGLPIVENGHFRIRNADADGIGEILLCGDNICAGYYKDEDATAVSFEDGWFCTGDYGKLDADGELTITGRKKNLIVLDNGKNICPEEIENYLLTQVNGIREAVVFESVKVYGETQSKIIAAAVYADPKDLTNSDLAQAEHKLKEALVSASFKLPAFMRIGDVQIFWQEFPKTATMKIIRQEVIALYNQKKGENENA